MECAIIITKHTIPDTFSISQHTKYGIMCLISLIVLFNFKNYAFTYHILYFLNVIPDRNN